MPEQLIPAGYGETEYIEKKSRFIGRVWHVESEEEALCRLRETRERHWDATHNVYAYSLRNGNVARFSDDGEPGGTSGLPTLNVFRKAGVEDFCCVVTRYFGGILLGAGGLVRAYSKTASLALAAAGKAALVTYTEAAVLCSYGQFERLKPQLSRFGAETVSVEYGSDVELRLLVLPEALSALERCVTELSGGSALFETAGERTRPRRL